MLGGRTGWEKIIELALDEDFGAGDITSLATVPAAAQSQGVLLVKAAGVISGLVEGLPPERAQGLAQAAFGVLQVLYVDGIIERFEVSDVAATEVS